MTSATLTSTSQTVRQNGEASFPSPLFREIASRFDDTTRRVILEPGATSEGMLQLLEGKRCRLLVADAALTLSTLGDSPEEVDSLQQRINASLFDPGDEKVDTVLCWDLLNYLAPAVLASFAARLTEIMAPQGVVHAYIHTAPSMIPARPQRYTALDAETVLRLDHDAAERKAPRYSARDLEKHGIGLRVERSVLLRNGMQEYLLRVDPTHTGPRDVKPLYRKPQKRK